MSVAQLWTRACLYSLFIISSIVLQVDSGNIKQLTFCEKTSSPSLLFVSTLDGKISALDTGYDGKKQWTLDLNDGPMLSSSIHRRELNNNGQWVRLIPSLTGGLYKFDGDNLEPVHVSVEQLLHSSFRYSDDLVFSGGKETRSYGVSRRTGKILYECGINGCTNNTDGEAEYIEQEVIIIQRFQQTVRAVEPRTGLERWNFSVGQHDLTLAPGSDSASCHEKLAHYRSDIEIKVVVPDGLVWAVDKKNPKVKLWQYKFDAPIVTIWREDVNGKGNSRKILKEINLFDSSQWSGGSISPGIYLGMHERQLYIQENAQLFKSLEATAAKRIPRWRYPWLPFPAVGNSLATGLIDEVSNPAEAHFEIGEAQSTTALSVLYNSEFINGNGFYLYADKMEPGANNNQCNGSNPDSLQNTTFVRNETRNDDEKNKNEGDDTPVQVIIVSLWYWWKEVLIISITTAVLLNFMLTQRLLNATTVASDAVLPPLIVERHIETRKDSSQGAKDEKDVDSFKSRYLTDFEPVDCLGKGGYGVVFEAKNKIDDCNYAIKRIALPNSEYARERVMREVKALAKLDHHNIVRYFNAWLECPPAGWQEHHDRQWLGGPNFPQSEFSPSETTRTETKDNNSVCIDVSRNNHSSVDSAWEAYGVLRRDSDEENSFIVFEHSEKAIDISNSSTENSDLLLAEDASVESVRDEETSRSESIVFEETSTEARSVEEEEEEKSARDSKLKEARVKRQRAISLNLSAKTLPRKSAKMFLYIQMQLCQRLSLREWLKTQLTRDTRRVVNIFQQIIDAVEYVHLQGLIHRDLKPSNIFFAYDDKIKIGDFGLVTAMTEGYGEAHTPSADTENISLKSNLHTAHVGTHLYMSPEQMNGMIYSYKVDIYSLGIILFELLIPFCTEMGRIDALVHLKKSIFPKDFEASYPAEFDLLKMMLDGNPDKRPTTLGIKARLPLSNYETGGGFNVNEDSKWHFELPPLTRHSSVTSNGSGDSWENVN